MNIKFKDMSWDGKRLFAEVETDSPIYLDTRDYYIDVEFTKEQLKDQVYVKLAINKEMASIKKSLEYRYSLIEPHLEYLTCHVADGREVFYHDTEGNEITLDGYIKLIEQDIVKKQEIKNETPEPQEDIKEDTKKKRWWDKYRIEKWRY